ncbi:MAG: hypothetical protein JO144_04450 [Actinobacteria bacterium]|nr:hypothetical protein [Actinomycetota bacterium]
MSWLTDLDSDSSAAPPPPRNRWKLVAGLLAGWLAVSLLVLVILLRFDGRDSGRRSTGTPTTSAPASSSSPAPSASATGSAGPVPTGWQLRAADDQANCAAHSYGQVQVFFARTPCTTVHRSLFSTSRAGRPVVVAASAVRFASSAQAAEYLRLVTSDGTGNVDDLLREGSRYPGSPSKLPPAAFASRQDGDRVLVAEAAFAEGPSDYSDATLRALARQAVDAG